jgi:murein L,D-transpeptidase YcbB/YkuD
LSSLASCSQPKKVSTTDSLKKNWNETIEGGFSGQSVLVFDSTEIATFLKKYPNVQGYESEIRSFYRKRNFAYAWFDKGSLIEQAGNLANKILNLESEGVYKQLRYQDALDSLMFGVSKNTDVNKPDIMLELLLTAEYFVFSKLAWEGMNKSVSKSSKWYLPRKTVAYDQYLDSLLTTPVGEPVEEEPVYRQYGLLKKYLKKYRKLDAEGTWAAIKISKKSLKPGDTSFVIKAIKNRLLKLEDFQGDTMNILFDDELSIAVKHFQNRNGLKPDGILNKETIVELNIPLKSRIKQILVNMERSRWLPPTLAGDYLAVNIPEFKLHVYHADSLLWSCNAVVGKRANATTLFYGEIKYVVFSPYWNVPPGILRNEIIPGMNRNPKYLANHNMEVTGYSGGLPVVRQRPGLNNSLGLVKFLFPNSYNIYLHDSPAKSLFGETSRAFSHGCIRIAEPAKLAGFLLKYSDDWNDEKIDKAMHRGVEQYVTLKNKVPVFIAYFTAFIDRDGRLNFRKDIYNLDDRLASMIISGDGAY